MNTSTRADRIATAQRLSAALRRMPGAPGPDDGATPGPIGHCGRGPDEECGMRNPQECEVHALPNDDDPALLNYSGTLRQRREQLRAAQRYGLQR
jgi:hypothetical protein